jgi:uncharacterized protein YqgV (UPF0045/DUF77 family)
MRKLAVLILFTSSFLFGQQATVFPPPSSFKYMGALAGIPATCSVGDIAFITNATAGQNPYYCTALNTWTQATGGGGGVGTVNAGTAGHLGYYATSAAAISDMGAAFTFSGSTLTGGFGSVLDMSGTGSTGFKFPVVAGAAPTVDGNCATDSTLHHLKCGSNGSTVDLQVMPNPSVSTLGGIQSLAAVTSKWINTISTSGVPSATQPAFTDISGSVAAGQMPALTGDVTSSAGTVATSVKQIHDNVTSVNNAASPYTVVATDSYISCDATAGAVVLNLPATTGSGRELTIKKIDSTASACTPTRNGSDVIDGATTVSLTVQYGAAKLVDRVAGTWDRTHINQFAGDVTGISTANTVVKVNGSTPGGTCTNQAVTSLSSSAVPTCNTITSSYVDTSIAKTGTDINTSNQVTAAHFPGGLPRAQGGLNSTSAGTGILRDGASPSASELSGDVTTSGTNAATIATGAVTDAKASLLNKPSAGLVATSNLTLSGAQTIDSVAGTAGTTIVLATAQTTGSENGPWVMQSGAWTRPTWYPSGGTTQAIQFATMLVRLGTVNAGTTWRLTTSGAMTIDTTATTWAITPYTLGSTTVAGTLPAAQLPNPSASTLGGIQSLASVSHQWINTISTSGVPSATQPAFTDISGSVAAGQMPALTGDCTTSAGAVATTCTKLNGTAFAGTSGNLVSFGAANIPADAGFLATNVVRKDAANTGAAAMSLDLSSSTVGGTAVTGFKHQVTAGAIPVADGTVANNSTNHTTVFGSAGTTTLVAAVAATSTGTATTCSNTVVTAISGIVAPTCTALTGAFLPNPSSSTLGGIQSIAAVTSKWINTISTSGVPTATQPSDSDIAFTDITTGNATTSAHGYMPKFPGGTSTYLRADGTFATPGGLTWTTVTGTSASGATNNAYIANNASLVTISLPATCTVGDVFEVLGQGTGLWKISQASGQTIHYGSSNSTTGTAGYLQAILRYDNATMICLIANTDFEVTSSVGNLTIN